MRKISKNLAVVLAVVMIAACASTSTVQVVYKVDAATIGVVDTAMKAYGELFRAGKISPDLELKIDKAHEMYRQAMEANVIAGKAYADVVAMNTATPEQLAGAKANADAALAAAGARLSELVGFLMQGGVPQSTFTPLAK